MSEFLIKIELKVSQKIIFLNKSSFKSEKIHKDS
jgi:hypothetical protein